MTTTAPITTVGEGLRALADVLDQHPELASEVTWSLGNINVPVSSADDPRSVLAAAARAGKAARATVEKSYDAWGHVVLAFGPVRLDFYAAREQVCERIVTGTTEVTREVPDPEALAAVPKTTVTETVETVEWRCLPLLAETESVQS